MYKNQTNNSEQIVILTIFQLVQATKFVALLGLLAFEIGGEIQEVL